MKLHLPLSLLSAVLLVAASLYSQAHAADTPLVLESGQELNLTGNTGGLQSPLILSDGILSIDYSNATTPASLNGNALSLSGGTALHLIPGTATDGRVINLLTNVGTLYGTDGTPLVLNEQNNAAANYFDTTQPGTGYWANATLQLSDSGTLQLVLHREKVKEALQVTTRQEGGADYQYHEGVTFSNIRTSSTDSDVYGGAIYGGSDSTITLSNNGIVNFSGNTVSSYDASSIYASPYGDALGGAICGGSDSTITLSNNGIVNFSGNTASSSYFDNARGGAICGDTITLNNNGSVTFRENSVLQGYGGAIHGDSYSTITLNNNNSLTFNGNSSDMGGALRVEDNSTLSVCNNGTVSFYNNSAGIGGAIAVGENSTLSLCGNGTVSFCSNSWNSVAGAIYGSNGSTITLSNNGSVTFSENSQNNYEASGGAIKGDTITMNNNSIVTFCDNFGGVGGAISGSVITLRNNGAVSFCGNSIESGVASYGGAINGNTILLCGNNTISFYGNSGKRFYGYGGAIKGDTILLCGNGFVSFCYNSAAAGYSGNGGAIYGSNGSTITLSNNSRVTFSANSANTGKFLSEGVYNSLGGAICTYGNLSLRNNESVLFEKNTEISTNGTYRLRSLYVGGSNNEISLSAAEGKHIEFRDSVYINSGSTIKFNEDYTTSEGTVHKQTGDIIFSGAYTEAHLMEMKGGIAGTAEEILASRTSEVYALTNLYGGRLRVEDGAIYKGWGITVHEGSAATLMLKNGELSHSGYDITIRSGSTLSALGESTITAANLIIQDGGTMQLALDMSQTDSAAVLTTTGNLSMNNISFNLTGTEYLVEGDYKLLTRTEGVDYDISGWTLNGVTSEQLRWEDGTLYYTGGHDWNHGVTDDDDISDLEEILGNLIINGGDVTLEAVVGAIQDAVDAGFGHGQGHIVINRGGIHISGAGDLDGHIIFNGDLKAIRKLFIEKDITGITIELGGNSQAENIVDVGDRHTMEIDSLSGEGGMNKTGKGEMVVHGNGHKVGGTLDVQEGTLTFTVANDTSGEAETEVHELVVGNKKDKEAKVKVDKDTKVKGNKMQVDGRHAVVTNNGTMEFTEEVKVKNGHLDNQGSISKVTLEGGKVSGSGTFAGLEMLGGELVVGNSPGLQTYTDDVELTEGEVTFSLADTETAATADTHGWSAAAYSTIDMGGNALTLTENVNFVLEIGGAALESLVAADGASLTFSLSLIQNIGAESLTLDSNALAALLGNTIIMITSDAEGLSAATLYLAGRDITALLSDGSYGYEGNTLVFKGTVTNDGSLTIPEPTTATLSLLALAALATRRRRR